MSTGIVKEGITKEGDTSAHALEFGRAWEYAPSPEATDHVRIAPRPV